MALMKSAQIKNYLVDMAVTASMNNRLIQSVMKSAPEDVKNRPVGYAIPLCNVAPVGGQNSYCKYNHGIYIVAYTGIEEKTEYKGVFSNGGYWLGGYEKNEMINGLYAAELSSANKELKKSLGNEWRLLAFIAGVGEDEALSSLPRPDEAEPKVIKVLKDLLSGKIERQTAALSYYFLPSISVDILRKHRSPEDITISALCYDDTVAEIVPLKINCNDGKGKILMHRISDRAYMYVKKWGIIRGDKFRVTEYFEAENGTVNCTDNASTLYEGVRAMISILNMRPQITPYYLSLPEGKLFNSQYSY